MINILHSCLFTVFFFLFKILLVFCLCLLGFVGGVVVPVEKNECGGTSQVSAHA